MQLVRGLDNLRVRLPGCVATIGNFDGVHLGHREMVREVKRHAARLGLPSVVITFEPSPREYFAHGGVVPARLTRLREKVAALADLGVDCLVLLRSTRRWPRFRQRGSWTTSSSAGWGSGTSW